MRVREKYREVRNTLRRSIFVGDRLERNMRNMMTEAIIVFYLSVIFLIVNLASGDLIMSISPVVFIVLTFVSYFVLKIWKNRTLSMVLTLIAVILVFSFDIVVVPNGFAFLWTLAVPLSVCYMFGIREGIAVTGYFQVLYIATFYTPLRKMVADSYTEIVMNRFPIYYFFFALLTIYVMYQYHKCALFEIDYTDRLNAEVERQTAVANERADRLETMSDEVVNALALSIDAKDPYTNGHSFRVSEYAAALARQLGWEENDIRAIRREAMLHDIGKIGIPDAVLNKPGKLTPDEYETIKSHTTMGWNILHGSSSMEGAADVARCHHERFGGGGYPAGLSGEQIPLHARVVTIADSYDTMRSDRIYRKGLSTDDIRSELTKCRGTQFDPVLLDAFMVLLDNGTLDGITERAKTHQTASVKIGHVNAAADWAAKEEAAASELS